MQACLRVMQIGLKAERAAFTNVLFVFRFSLSSSLPSFLTRRRPAAVPEIRRVSTTDRFSAFFRLARGISGKA